VNVLLSRYARALLRSAGNAHARTFAKGIALIAITHRSRFDQFAGWSGADTGGLRVKRVPAPQERYDNEHHDGDVEGDI
jgi:hypothetical protein